ncbi:hypothetical protein GQF61_03650 [Sphingobacterium sp. DK4209]|uniref:BIG2 domain-containing protein n=1 Tax=Sphingobacterium zhuxiongii TaxID=2662364 RepID=A0A5Q0Q725_9SPHI|nr:MULTISPECIES: hypothetical protein [unclassified Sphingobacterium]MVZ64933.1 hypothetical protein [Sphingobacterium sp. DK4209]QGA25273.1 hypothetical protein GFH32_02610 [Sphingobacterium sp. dk4302]
MKTKNIIRLLILAGFGTALSYSCKKNDVDFGENLTVREAVNAGGNMQIPVKIGTPLQLNLAITPGNRTVTDASYKNKHTDISTFSSSGLVTGVSEGKDTVVISSGNLQVWYVVNVTK